MVHTAPAIDLRIRTLSKWGEIFRAVGEDQPWPGSACGLTQDEYQEFVGAIDRAYHSNGWFEPDQVRHALRSLGEMMQEETLHAWIGAYPALKNGVTPPRKVGMVMAGNIPMVGFHDLLCVLASGHLAAVKCASQDDVLIPAALDVLELIGPDLRERVELRSGKLGDVDAVIATGSNNSARYFEHYFGHLPHIIRRNRTSVAVITEEGSNEELARIGEDVFRYFGLGCRNVSKIFVPADYDLDRFFKAIYPWKKVLENSKYTNNYDYHKALWLLDSAPILENGFLILKEDKAMSSPVGSLYYERYSDIGELELLLAEHADEIQCIVGHKHIPFGEAQQPGLADYADGVDTMEFLLALS